MLGVCNILDLEQTRDLKESCQKQAEKQADTGSNECQHKSFWCDRRLRYISRILHADRLALCIGLDADDRLGLVLFL